MTSLIENFVVVARYGLALVFIVAGVSMIGLYDLAQAYLVAMGLPGALLPWFIIVVIAAAVSLVTGYRMQWAALAMALLAFASALLLPEDFAGHAATETFFRNTSVATVLLLMAAGAAGCWSADRRSTGAGRYIRINNNPLPTGARNHD